MSKIIVVDGPPGSGVTLTAIKLAQEIHAKANQPVVYISSDTLVPTMGIIFPHIKKNKQHSLGRVLDRTEIQPDHVLAEMNTPVSMVNMGYLGYLAGEDSFTYPEPTDGKVHNLFQSLGAIAGYIVVDCDRDREDLISGIARGLADCTVNIINPDVRSMSYYKSNPISTDALKVMNLHNGNMYLPIREVVAHFKGVPYSIPFSKELQRQELNGTLSQYLKDGGYRRAMSAIAKAVM